MTGDMSDNTAWHYILHADLDAFFASVEQRDNPELQGKPVVVGGPTESRGVVAAASYESRRYGIHSAMPMRTAFRLCPDLVRVSARFSRYREVSRQVMDVFRAVTPLVEPLSLDEAYLDISEQASPEKAPGKAPVEMPVPVEMNMPVEINEVAVSLKAGVREETGLAITIGGGTSKTVAKIASQLAKPDGLLLVKPGEEREFLAPLDIDMLWGVGPKTAVLLRRHGISLIGDLATCADAWLLQNFGKRGPELKDRALGVGNSQVTTHRDTKSVSAETTMSTDVDREEVLMEHLDSLAQRVAQRLQASGLRGKTVGIKLRLADFTTFTRQKTLPTPTDDPEVIIHVARELFRREMRPGLKYRLLGVGVANFQTDFQLGLLPLGH